MINLHDFITQSNLYKNLTIDDLLLVRYDCMVNERQSEIWSHTNYIAYVLGGKKKWKTPNNEFLVNNGDMLFVRKGANTVYQYFDEPFFVLFVFLTDEYIHKTLTRYGIQYHSLNVNGTHQDDLILFDRNEVFESFFHSLKAYFSEDVHVTKELLKLKMDELILNIMTQPGNHLLKALFGRLGETRKVNLEQIMRDSYLHPFSINDLARLCARSPASFRRDFKNIFHTTPSRWLLKKRLEHSRFLLQTTDQPVSAVCDDCGFKNRSHFMKSFKIEVGVSPGQFRSQMKMRKTGS